MSDTELLEQARKKLRGVARAYGRAADGPGRDAAIVELECAALVMILAAARKRLQLPRSVEGHLAEAFTAAKTELGL